MKRRVALYSEFRLVQRDDCWKRKTRESQRDCVEEWKVHPTDHEMMPHYEDILG